MSQLERLARPFPAKYVKKPPSGKFGSFVPQSIVQQALLAIVGAHDLSVGEVFTGDDGRIEGCLVTLTVEVDGRRVSVTEIGDVEQPGNWKTQGARMKDAISDGVKRCAMRLGLGLHLWAQEDYFLYDQLKSQGTGTGEHPPETAGPVSSPIVAGPATSKARIQGLVARLVSLRADNVDIDAAQAAWNLPQIADCDEKQLGLWDEMLSDEEKKVKAPFVEAPA